MMDSAAHFEDLSRDGWNEMVQNYFQKEASLQEAFVNRVLSDPLDEYGGE